MLKVCPRAVRVRWEGGIVCYDWLMFFLFFSSGCTSTNARMAPCLESGVSPLIFFSFSLHFDSFFLSFSSSLHSLEEQAHGTRCVFGGVAFAT
jgi:hypothetical protein